MSQRRSVRPKRRVHESGQAVVEFAMIATLLLILLCASIDFGRALNYVQGLIELTRQGSMLASRGSTLTEAATAVMAGQSSLDMTNNGKVIITAVTNNKNALTISGQTTQGSGGPSCSSGCSSVVGSGVGSAATIPAAAAATIQSGQTLYVTEIYYSFAPITPLGRLTPVIMPSKLYESAYF
jgi:Flp pilus assembly protein TadG